MLYSLPTLYIYIYFFKNIIIISSICRFIQFEFSDAASFSLARRRHLYSNFEKLTPDIGWPALTYDDEEHEYLPTHETHRAPLQ
jgi:hypothetical protein